MSQPRIVADAVLGPSLLKLSHHRGDAVRGNVQLAHGVAVAIREEHVVRHAVRVLVDPQAGGGAHANGGGGAHAVDNSLRAAVPGDREGMEGEVSGGGEC